MKYSYSYSPGHNEIMRENMEDNSGDIVEFIKVPPLNFIEAARVDQEYN